MTQLISAFKEFDEFLVQSLDVKLEPTLLLEDIQVGSMSTWLSNGLKKIPDSAIENLDWKQVIGHYLVKSKHLLIKWLDGKQNIESVDEIIEIQHQVLDAAKETRTSQLDSYSQIHPRSLITSINRVNNALSNLERNGDSAEFISVDGNAKFNLSLEVNPESLEALITRETISSESTMILKVKKPDYLGNSMWEFNYDHIINVKILDYVWLKDFQNRKVDVRPGDAVRGRVRTSVKYGYDNSIVDTRYEMLKIIEVIPTSPPLDQGQLFNKLD